MSYIKHDDLFKKIVARALNDREAFLDAAQGNPEMIENTQREIAQIKALKGLSLKAALDVDEDGVRTACLYAEQYYYGLADAQVGGESKRAMSMFKVVREFRMKRFGATQLESQMSRMKLVPMSEILKTYHQ